MVSYIIRFYFDSGGSFYIRRSFSSEDEMFRFANFFISSINSGTEGHGHMAIRYSVRRSRIQKP